MCVVHSFARNLSSPFKGQPKPNSLIVCFEMPAMMVTFKSLMVLSVVR
jgi:hypothetical protein